MAFTKAVSNITACLLFLSFTLFSVNSFAEPKNDRKGKIKAATVFHLLKFIRFPDSENEAASREMCVIGEDPLNKHLEKTLKGKKIHNKKIIVVFAKDIEKLPTPLSCNIVYFGDTDSKAYERLVQKAGDSTILTIGGKDRIIDQGAVIQLVESKNKLKIQVNNKAAAKKGFRISSELLSIAEVIDPG